MNCACCENKVNHPVRTFVYSALAAAVVMGGKVFIERLEAGNVKQIKVEEKHFIPRDQQKYEEYVWSTISLETKVYLLKTAYKELPEKEKQEVSDYLLEDILEHKHSGFSPGNAVRYLCSLFSPKKPVYHKETMEMMKEYASQKAEVKK